MAAPVRIRVLRDTEVTPGRIIHEGDEGTLVNTWNFEITGAHVLFDYSSATTRFAGNAFLFPIETRGKEWAIVGQDAGAADAFPRLVDLAEKMQDSLNAFTRAGLDLASLARYVDDTALHELARTLGPDYLRKAEQIDTTGIKYVFHVLESFGNFHGLKLREFTSQEYCQSCLRANQNCVCEYVCEQCGMLPWECSCEMILTGEEDAN